MHNLQEIMKVKLKNWLLNSASNERRHFHQWPGMTPISLPNRNFQWKEGAGPEPKWSPLSIRISNWLPLSRPYYYEGQEFQTKPEETTTALCLLGLAIKNSKSLPCHHHDGRQTSSNSLNYYLTHQFIISRDSSIYPSI